MRLLQGFWWNLSLQNYGPELCSTVALVCGKGSLFVTSAVYQLPDSFSVLTSLNQAEATGLAPQKPQRRSPFLEVLILGDLQEKNEQTEMKHENIQVTITQCTT